MAGLFAPGFVADEQTTGTLELSEKHLAITRSDKPGEFVISPNIPFNPATDLWIDMDWIYTDAQGTKYRIDPVTGQTLSIEDRQGNRLVATEAGITGSSAAGGVTRDCLHARRSRTDHLGDRPSS